MHWVQLEEPAELPWELVFPGSLILWKPSYFPNSLTAAHFFMVCAQSIFIYNGTYIAEWELDIFILHDFCLAQKVLDLSAQTQVEAKLVCPQKGSYNYNHSFYLQGEHAKMGILPAYSSRNQGVVPPERCTKRFHRLRTLVPMKVDDSQEMTEPQTLENHEGWVVLWQKNTW